MGPTKRAQESLRIEDSMEGFLEFEAVEKSWTIHMRHAIVEDIWRKHAEKGASRPSTFVDYYPQDTIEESAFLYNLASFFTHLAFICLRQLRF